MTTTEQEETWVDPVDAELDDVDSIPLEILFDGVDVDELYVSSDRPTAGTLGYNEELDWDAMDFEID